MLKWGIHSVMMLYVMSAPHVVPEGTAAGRYFADSWLLWAYVEQTTWAEHWWEIIILLSLRTILIPNPYENVQDWEVG